jgi:hypothetical protein
LEKNADLSDARAVETLQLTYGDIRAPMIVLRSDRGARDLIQHAGMFIFFSLLDAYSTATVSFRGVNDPVYCDNSLNDATALRVAVMMKFADAILGQSHAQ